MASFISSYISNNTLQNVDFAPLTIAFMQVTLMISAIGIAICFFLANTIGVVAFSLAAISSGMGLLVLSDQELSKEIDKSIHLAARTVLDLKFIQQETKPAQQALQKALSFIDPSKKKCFYCSKHLKEIKKIKNNLLEIERRLAYFLHDY